MQLFSKKKNPAVLRQDQVRGSVKHQLIVQLYIQAHFALSKAAAVRVPCALAFCFARLQAARLKTFATTKGDKKRSLDLTTALPGSLRALGSSGGGSSGGGDLPGPEALGRVEAAMAERRRSALAALMSPGPSLATEDDEVRRLFETACTVCAGRCIVCRGMSAGKTSKKGWCSRLIKGFRESCRTCIYRRNGFNSQGWKMRRLLARAAPAR